MQIFCPKNNTHNCPQKDNYAGDNFSQNWINHIFATSLYIINRTSVLTFRPVAAVPARVAVPAARPVAAVPARVAVPAAPLPAQPAQELNQTSIKVELLLNQIS